jgi:hypothetical protein
VGVWVDSGRGHVGEYEMRAYGRGGIWDTGRGAIWDMGREICWHGMASRFFKDWELHSV